MSDEAPQAEAPNPGVSNGTVVTSPDGSPEKIVHENGPNGEIMGWHKEAVSG